MEFRDNVPIYMQIIEIIKKQIITNKLKTGEQIPSVRNFSQEYMVNLNTVQKAYMELERQGIIFTKRGMGNFVSKDKNIVQNLKKQMSLELIKNFKEEMRDLGFSREKVIKMLGGKDE